MSRWKQRGIDHLILTETKTTYVFGMVVKPDSSDPGLSFDPVPIDTDHKEFAISSFAISSCAKLGGRSRMRKERSMPSRTTHRRSARMVPISIRFETNQASIFYEAMAHQLARIANGKAGDTQRDAGEFYRDRCLELLHNIAEKRFPTLVIVDGLDEAAGWLSNAVAI